MKKWVWFIDFSNHVVGEVGKKLIQLQTWLQLSIHMCDLCNMRFEQDCYRGLEARSHCNNHASLSGQVQEKIDFGIECCTKSCKVKHPGLDVRSAYCFEFLSALWIGHLYNPDNCFWQRTLYACILLRMERVARWIPLWSHSMVAKSFAVWRSKGALHDAQGSDMDVFERQDFFSCLSFRVWIRSWGRGRRVREFLLND